MAKCTLITTVCVCVCLSLTAFLHFCTHPDVTLGNGKRCPLVVYYWTNLQLVPGFHCYGNIHIRILYYRPGCNTNAYPSTLILFVQLPVKFNKTCTEREMLANACTDSINWYYYCTDFLFLVSIR